MGNNYNIQFNPEEPSKESIQKHMDFDALLQRFEAEQPPKSKARVRQLYLWGGAIAAAVAAILIVIGIGQSPASSVDEAAYFQAQAFVNPPLEQIKPTFASYSVNTNQGGVYEYETGSRLVVPAEAFMDDYGKLIEGEVAIHYREMHDYVDFFLSGIPMSYDSAGVRYNLESAGMVEIFAEQNGQRVRMAPGKSIDVELVATINVPNLNIPPKYNIYKLDTEARNWEYQDIDRIQLLDETVLEESDPLYEAKQTYLSTLAQIEQRIEEALGTQEMTAEPEAPRAPQAYDKNYPTLELDFLESVLQGNQQALLQLKEQYGDVIWQIAPSSPAYDERAFEVVWQSASLEPLQNDEFKLTLMHEDTQVPLHVRPVLMGAEYEQAMALHQDQLAAYEKELAAWNARLAEQRTALEATMQAERKAAKETYDAAIASINNQTADARFQRKIVNRFQAKSFGIWNCDRPIAPDYQEVEATFSDNTGKAFNQKTGYLVDKKKNTIFRFLATDGATVPFDANSENMLWVVTDDNQIAIYKPEAFKRINQKKGSHNFELQRIDRKVEDEQDIREMLEF
ncbi:MAG: hypothetical protein AAF798_09740 [Bacteroidota bacterium]